MELRALVEVNVVRNERTYRLLIPLGTPFAEAYEVLATELKEAVEFLEKQQKDQAAQQATQAEEVTAEPVQPDVAAGEDVVTPETTD